MGSLLNYENEKRADHEKIIELLMEEIKELKQGPKVDEENRRLKEQLKWKREQFKHLEEAHHKLKDEFLRNKEDWDVARSALEDEVFELKTKLESHTQVSNELQSRLDMCDQALVRDESKIRSLEAEHAETKAFYEKALDELRETKFELENLMMCRDEEIGNLRSSLVEKEAMCKEYEYMTHKTEQENQELLVSIKELQEAQIQGASSSASSSMLTRVKSRLRSMEQKHKDKEAEWSLKLEKLAEKLKMKDEVIIELSSKLEGLEKVHMNCSSNLEINDEHVSVQLEQMSKEPNKDDIIAELKMELKECNSTIMQLKVENEETSLKLSAYVNSFAKMESERVEMEKLHESPLHEALLEELERHKGMVIEMSENEQCLKEQCMAMECELKERMQEVCDALTRADTELAAASCKVSETEFELQQWKVLAERLEISLVESQMMRKQVEHSLLQEVEIAEMLKQEKTELYEDVTKLSTERENLMEYVKELCDRISKFSSQDLQLMGKVGNILRKFGDPEPKMELAGKEDKFNPLKENLNINISPTIEKFEILSNGRSPFRD